MKDYLLVFRGGLRADESSSPELWQQHMMKWKTWMDGLAKDGKLAGGERLMGNAGAVVKGEKKQVIDGPYAEGKEVLGGYIIVKAAGLPEAIDISKGCPIFEYDGSVEVREVAKM